MTNAITAFASYEQLAVLVTLHAHDYGGCTNAVDDYSKTDIKNRIVLLNYINGCTDRNSTSDAKITLKCYIQKLPSNNSNSL